jgi:hypothetical protein
VIDVKEWKKVFSEIISYLSALIMEMSSEWLWEKEGRLLWHDCFSKTLGNQGMNMRVPNQEKICMNDARRKL